jgi:hypothetical protein
LDLMDFGKKSKDFEVELLAKQQQSDRKSEGS